MEPSATCEICVFPVFDDNGLGGCPGAAIAGNDFNLEINVIVKHTYTCGESTADELICDNTFSCKCKSLSWDEIDQTLLETDFPYPLERIKWDPTEKILENKDDLIEQILEFVHQNIVTGSPVEYLDEVYVSLVFVKQVSVTPQEFELTKARILAVWREYCEELIRREVYDKITRSGRESSLYECLKWIECCIQDTVSGTSQGINCFDENDERELMQTLIEEARKAFRLLPEVRSRVQCLQKVNLPSDDDELTADICSICMEKYLPDSEAYSMPCSHTFHFDCIETWLLKDPSCPMCRYKLPPIELEAELEN
ncbi:uncharacterized protein LOC132624661 [Lycium barbarum]|uniref:uncharacterized protein LOC132624661 n=1 Tax=Lycium barbarum TaxID=112863 RepID=UPI00293E61AE|nr:uncharacterized protein LOC132624661 [Lycium barbarum]